MKKLLKIIFVVLVLPLIFYEGYFQILQYKNRVNAKKVSQSSLTNIRYVDRGYYWNYPYSEKFIAYNEDGEQIEINTDNFGFRNPITQENNLKYDVLLLGDSFTAAANTRTERTYAEHIRKSGLSLYNAGIDGTGTVHQAHILRDMLEKIQPKVVVLNFYLGNDFRDNFYCAEIGTALEQVKAQTPSIIPKLKASLNNLMQYSGVLKLIYNAVYLPAKYEGTDMSYYNRGEMMIMAHQSDNAHPDVTIAIEKTDKALSYIKNSLEKKNIKLLVVGIPSKAQVIKSIREISNHEQDPKAGEFFAKVKNHLEFDRPDQILADLCRKNNIEYFSLMKPFRKASDQKLYYHFDAHWTYVGQEVAAQHVIPRVQAMLVERE